MSAQRLLKLQSLMASFGFQAIAINAGGWLKYITGLEFHLSERPIILLVPQNGEPALFFPKLEQQKAISSNIPLKLFAYGEDSKEWADNLRSAMDELGLNGKAIGVPPESMRFLELELLKNASDSLHFSSAAELFKKLIIQKDKIEIDCIKKAVSIAEKALLALLSSPISGCTEREIANRLVIKLLENGSEPNLPFNPIIASGANSANPHAVPGDRIILEGDLVVIDWGATVGGYISDITRTFQVGHINQNFERIAEVVLQANHAAREIAKPGISASVVDGTARSVITAAGYADYFTHRTGHGIGMFAHEEPYISETSQTELAPGMVFTIEPGIYFPDRGGIRIEDDVLISMGGVETLTSLPRKIMAIN